MSKLKKAKLNTELADQIMHWIKEEQEREDKPTWDQGHWLDHNEHEPVFMDCGTSCCAAGYIAIVTDSLSNRSTDPDYKDYLPNLDKMKGRVNHLGMTWEEYSEAEFSSTYFSFTYAWEAIGAFYLGINHEQAAKLFGATNTARDLEIMFKELRETGDITYVAED